MHSYYKEATVGGLVIVAVVLFLWGALWLTGGTWNRAGLVPVWYQDIGTLKDGAPVRISGAQVGRVESIHYRGVGRVLVLLDLDRKRVALSRNASAEIVAVGMLGDAMIDLLPGEGEPITPADTLSGTLGTRDLMSIGTEVAGKVSNTLEGVNRLLDTTITAELRQTLISSNKLLTYLADPAAGPTAEMNSTMRAFRSTAARLDSSLAQLDLSGVQSDLRTTMRSADTTLRALNELSIRLTAASGLVDSILGDIHQGKGTLGKLAADSSLYLDLQRMLQATTRLVDELARNPGKIGITVKIP